MENITVERGVIAKIREIASEESEDSLGQVSNIAEAIFAYRKLTIEKAIYTNATYEPVDVVDHALIDAIEKVLYYGPLAHHSEPNNLSDSEKQILEIGALLDVYDQIVAERQAENKEPSNDS